MTRGTTFPDSEINPGSHTPSTTDPMDIKAGNRTPHKTLRTNISKHLNRRYFRSEQALECRGIITWTNVKKDLIVILVSHLPPSSLSSTPTTAHRLVPLAI
ncbi:hypothetical protein PGT21_018434 [Puccinia graminis f. sp. tritici]|uniref:Uncharacterized protein n=1 Tax=Puccinia graminis f. sp. tritici TaxID=56615 RepID=A0A5B0Q605_PUCGR|nr:hypothetical protein PGT21_018434 [Puccinia graminis f. sp. tritici]